jgi:dTDP-4-amino-4,6-dideoxygalactose transaminase
MTTIATFISKHEIYLVLVTQAYCVKCKSKRDMKNEKQITMKNGRQALSGTCSVCGTKMFKIGGGSALVQAKQHPKVKAASKKPAGKARAKTSKSKKKR